MHEIRSILLDIITRMCQKESQLGMIKQRKEKQTKVGECDISGVVTTTLWTVRKIIRGCYCSDLKQ